MANGTQIKIKTTSRVDVTSSSGFVIPDITRFNLSAYSNIIVFDFRINTIKILKKDKSSMSQTSQAWELIQGTRLISKRFYGQLFRNDPKVDANH